MNTIFPICFLLCSLIATHAASGLRGDYYAGWIMQSNQITFEGLTLQMSRVDTNFNIWNGDRYSQWNPVGNIQFSIHWTGYLHLTNSGVYGFGTISDDGSEIWIDDKFILDNNDQQWFRWREAYCQLGAGYHKLEIKYYEALSYSGIEVWWLPPTNQTSVAPYSGLTFHASAANWPAYQTNTLWKIIPASVLSTDAPYVNPSVIGRFVPASGQIELTWLSSSNVTYTIESSTNLVVWQPIVGPFLGTGTNMTQPLPRAKPAEFYRLRLD